MSGLRYIGTWGDVYAEPLICCDETDVRPTTRRALENASHQLRRVGGSVPSAIVADLIDAALKLTSETST